MSKAADRSSSRKAENAWRKGCGAVEGTGDLDENSACPGGS